MSGYNYLVSANEVKQNEKKLKVKSLLKILYTHSKGERNLKHFFSEFSEPSQENCDTDYVTCFLYINVLRKVSNYVLSSLLYTSGYVTQKLMSKIQCDECKDLIGDKNAAWTSKLVLNTLSIPKF